MAKDKLKNMRLAMEKDLAELFKHIREQDFGSEEELQKFLNEAVVGKKTGPGLKNMITRLRRKITMNNAAEYGPC